MKFINKTRYRKDVIRAYYTREQNISKTKITSKIVISKLIFTQTIETI